MTLNVIGAGFGRTGTDSLRKALDMLGVVIFDYTNGKIVGEAASHDFTGRSKF